MLMLNGVLDIFGLGGVGPDDFDQAILNISNGIVYARFYFPKNESVFLNRLLKNGLKVLVVLFLHFPQFIKH
jgi:hypothetical protein